jgi:hypothetical protein
MQAARLWVSPLNWEILHRTDQIRKRRTWCRCTYWMLVENESEGRGMDYTSRRGIPITNFCFKDMLVTRTTLERGTKGLSTKPIRVWKPPIFFSCRINVDGDLWSMVSTLAQNPVLETQRVERGATHCNYLSRCTWFLFFNSTFSLTPSSFTLKVGYVPMEQCVHFHRPLFLEVQTTGCSVYFSFEYDRATMELMQVRMCIMH